MTIGNMLDISMETFPGTIIIIIGRCSIIWRVLIKNIKCFMPPGRKKFRNNNRMWVNGKYIRQDHPLHKPGRYKNFEQAAFSSLEKYESSVEGQVYAVTNPSFPDWVKVGMAIDAKDRCNQYQTSSPHRDYKLCYSKFFDDRSSAEKKAHTLLKKESEDNKGEWFKIKQDIAQEIIETL
jgi:hypothetical protein